tara:strand:+ start:363 stop:1418 length:1056 start_codon:yes stop_codon:yes gene_type:complete
MLKIYNEISPDLRKQWIELENNAEIFPFQKLEWIESYINNLGTKDDKFIYVCVFEDDILKVIFPLSIVKVGFVKLLCFTGFKFTDYCYPIADKNYDLNLVNLEQIFQDLLRNNKFDCVFIKNQKEKFFNKENIFFKYFNLNDKYKEDLSYQIQINTDWKNFIGKKRERKIRSLNNTINKNLGTNFNFKINVNDLSLNEKKEIVDFLIKKKRDQLNRTKIFHYLNNSRYENFLKQLFINSSSGLILFSYIKNKNDLLAVHVGFNFKKTFYYMFPVFDYKYKKLSAGKFLLTKLLEDCFNHDFTCFDFTTGKENYKKEWSNQEAVLYSFIKEFTLIGKIFRKILLFYKSITKS